MHYLYALPIRTLLYAVEPLPITVEPSLICTTYNSRNPLICTTYNSITLLYALPITVEPSYMHYL